MKRVSLCFSLLFGFVAASMNLTASDGPAAFNSQLNRIVVHLNREVRGDAEGPIRMAELIQRQYGTEPDQIRWAVDHSVPWGEAVVLAYIRSTKGRTFERISNENARNDFGAYTDKAGINFDIMVHSLENFLKTAENEHNSRVFDRLRVSRRVQALPDLGSGFGLFQDGLDFRQLNPPQPTKINVVASGLAKE